MWIYFTLPSKHLFKASASTRKIAVHTLNFFEQVLASWNPRYEIRDVPDDFTFKTCICASYIKKLYCISKSFFNEYILWKNYQTYKNSTQTLLKFSLIFFVMDQSDFVRKEFQKQALHDCSWDACLRYRGSSFKNFGYFWCQQ